MTRRRPPRTLAEPALLDALAAAWREDNATRFDGALRRPVFALHDGTHRLGFWEASTRTLSLARSLVWGPSWVAVREVLRHEAAHQYVHEVLGVVDEPPHGPAFRAVCAERGIDGRAAGAVSLDGPEEAPPVLRRIRKLLARADGPDTGEARTASRLAWRLMARHGLTRQALGEEAPTTVAQLGPVASRHPLWRRLLMGVVSQHHQVAVTQVPAFDVARGRPGTAFEVTGDPAQVAIASHVVDWFAEAAELAWRRHRAGTGASGRAAANRFREGLVLGYRERIADEARRAEQEEGLVLVGDPATEAFIARRHPRRRRGRGLRVRTDGDHAAGRDAGRRLRWRRPIGSTASRSGRALSGPTDRGSSG